MERASSGYPGLNLERSRPRWIRRTPHSQQESSKCQMGSAQAGALFPEGGLHRPTLSPSPRSERYSRERVSPSSTKNKSVLASVICPMASFIIRITYRGKNTSFEVRQSWVLTSALLTSGLILGRSRALAGLSTRPCLWWGS